VEEVDKIIFETEIDYTNYPKINRRQSLIEAHNTEPNSDSIKIPRSPTITDR